MLKRYLFLIIMILTTTHINASGYSSGIEITLKRDGWNLVAICQDMNASDIDMTNIEEIQDQDGKSIYTGEFAQYSNLEQLKAGYGYWVKSNRGVKFKVGKTTNSLSVPLKRDGWNLIGICQDMPKESIDMTNIEEIQDQDGKSIYTGEFAQYSNLEQLDSGFGYWVKGNRGVSFAVTINQNQEIHITEDNYQVIPLDTSSGTINTKIYLDSNAKSLYLVLTNTDSNSSTTPTISHSNKVVKKENKKVTTVANIPKIKHTPTHIAEFNYNSIDLLEPNTKQNRVANVENRSNSVVGDTHTFYLDADGDVTTVATLKKVVSNIDTEFGTKTLNIWVSNDSFGSGCSKAKCLTQDMVDTLADKFLKSGADNDIYDWVTNIYGEEWGADANSKYSNVIGETNTVDILVTDIDNDNNANRGVIGYFWSKDNFKNSSVSGSNERIMFYIDSVMYANTSNGDYWQKEAYVTLAHEFQHMINYYQKSIKNEHSSELWLNELMSVTTEDFIVTKLQHNGNRGVDYIDGSAGESGNTHGLFPLFNENIDMSITNWAGELKDYAKVASFGAFLARNYGGAELFKAMIQNSYTDEQAIINAIYKTTGESMTFDELLQKWGVAIMLSEYIDLDRNLPKYNIGDFFTSSLNGILYELGSINFFNYNPQPNIKTVVGSINPQANYYYEIGRNIRDGSIDLNMTLDSTIKVVLIAK